MENLVNLMEKTVINKINELWPKTEYCKCDQCKLDIAAYALNRLAPQYVHSIRGKVMYRFEENTIQKGTEVTVVVSKGIEVVGKAPHKEAIFNTDSDAAEGKQTV